jgi:hypothetical protein
MSRMSNPGCMLRVTSALFGTIFLPVGVSFFFVLKHQHWLEGVAAVVAALGFFYVAWRADDLLGLDEILNTADISLPAPADRPATPPTGDDPESTSLEQEPHP